MTEPGDPEKGGEDPRMAEPVFVADLVDSIAEGDRAWLSRNLLRLHPADAADALEQLDREIFCDGISQLGGEMPSNILIELRDEYRQDAVKTLPDEVLGAAIADLHSDDATTILEDLAEDRRGKILAEIAPSERLVLESGLAFEPETAGRLMQREFVAVPEFWTVGETVDHARAQGEALPEQFYEIYVVDPAMHVRGVVVLSMLLRNSRDLALEDIMEPLESDIRGEMDQEEVAYQFQKYSLAQAPVMDRHGRLIGIITVDDMVDVIQDENTEDLLALSNVRSADASDTVWTSVRARAPWLVVNLGTAFVASAIISLFDMTLDRIVQLAILMPMVSALGGNAGSQGLAVSVRAIAERELEGPATRRAVLREILTGLANGALFAFLVGGVVFAWFLNPGLAGVTALAVFATFAWAGMLGILVPLALKRLGADPAVASSVFVLTMVDIAAFACYLGLATWLLLA